MAKIENATPPPTPPLSNVPPLPPRRSVRPPSACPQGVSLAVRFWTSTPFLAPLHPHLCGVRRAPFLFPALRVCPLHTEHRDAPTDIPPHRPTSALQHTHTCSRHDVFLSIPQNSGLNRIARPSVRTHPNTYIDTHKDTSWHARTDTHVTAFGCGQRGAGHRAEGAHLAVVFFAPFFTTTYAALGLV